MCSGGLAQKTMQFLGSVKPGSMLGSSSLKRNGSMRTSLKSEDRNLSLCWPFRAKRCVEYSDWIWACRCADCQRERTHGNGVPRYVSIYGKHETGEKLQLASSFSHASIRAWYGFSPGWMAMPERSSSLFLASVDSSAGPISSLPLLSSLSWGNGKTVPTWYPSASRRKRGVVFLGFVLSGLV